MKILYILKQKADATASAIIAEHKKTNDVTVINIYENRNYDDIVDLIAASDKVISW